MIQDVKLGTHRIGTYMYASVSVRSCSAFVWKISSKNLLFFRRKSSKSQIMWVWKGVWPQEGLKYDDSYCDKF